MNVSVNFYGVQREVTCTDHIQVPLSRGTRVTEILYYIKECYPELPLNEGSVMVTVNNRVSSLDQVLKTDDKISFIPHIGGG